MFLRFSKKKLKGNKQISQQFHFDRYKVGITRPTILSTYFLYANVKGKLVLRKVFYWQKMNRTTLESGTRLQCFRLDFPFAPSLG